VCRLPQHVLDPSRLDLQLFDHQREHPHRFVIRMSDLRVNRTERLLVARDFL
jgi:hypothetical protein